MLRKNNKFKKAGTFLTWLLMVSTAVYSQQRSRLDSLVATYESGGYQIKDKLQQLKEIAQSYTDPEKKMAYSEALIKAAKQVDSLNFLCVGYLEKGHALHDKSELNKALAYYFEAAKIAKNKQLGVIYFSIADVYSTVGNNSNAVNYYQKAISILKYEKDTVNEANALYNLGDHYLQNNKLDSALMYTKQSQVLFQKIHAEAGEAYCLGNLGKIYSESDNDMQAEFNLNKAIGLLEHINEYPAICEYLLDMANIYHQKGAAPESKNYALKSLTLAQKYGLKKEISDASLKLSLLYENSGDPIKALAYYKSYKAYFDSVINLETNQKAADQLREFEVSTVQKEVDLLATRNKLRIAERNGFIFASLLLAVVLAISIYFYSQRAKRNQLIAAQKMQEAEIVHQKLLMQSVITSQETERKRIGMDLHDEVGAALSTLRIKIEKNAGGDEKAGELAAEFKSDIDKVIANMRNISHSLSPRISGSFGFYDAVYELSDNVNRSGKINMLVNFDEEKLPAFANEQVPMAIYRVLSELINNTLKHASAKSIHLHVTVTDDNMDIQYRDDGIGIAEKDACALKGIGMQNIESRLSIIGAEWQIQDPEGGGYGVIISVPLK